MSDWVKVKDDVMKEVGELFTSAASMAGKTGYPLDLPRDLVSGLLTYLSEDMGCDHSVNVCTCQMAEVAYKLKLALNGQEVCPRCHGEGFTDDEHGRPATCQKCFTSGVAWMETEDE